MTDLTAECQAAIATANGTVPAACNNLNDHAVLDDMQFGLSGSVNSVTSDQEIVLKNTGTGSCSLLSPSNWFTNCIWLPLMSWLGSWFLTIGGALLQVAGTLFDMLISKVIVNFKGTLEFLSITTAIDAGWTVFRDFSNILIIGIFVFIAISIILGLEEFGQKKMIARVLIVAILINFSLLFTKMVIDGSNFVAFQIYSNVSAVSASVNDPNKDISQAFLKPMGIGSVWDTQGVTNLVAKQTNSGLQAFFFGLVGGIMLLAVAGVLFYGCFLIAARAILFIFLMLTAALAFATYLVPSFANGEYGWSSWWKALINNAIFAPLLMLFLAVSLSIVNAAGNKLGTTTGAATIGSVISNPQSQLSGNGWVVIMLYVIGIGLLFVSFKMASKFAGTISGFNMAAAIPALGLAAGARVAAFAGRNAIGRPALRASEALQARAKGREGTMAGSLYKFGSQGLKGVGKSDFNAMRTPLGAGIAGLTNLKADTLAGKGIGGAEGMRKAAAKRAAENAQFFAVSDSEKKERGEKAVNTELRTNADLAQRHAEASQAADTHEAEHRSATESHKAAQEELVKAVAALERAKGGDAEIAATAEHAVSRSQENLKTQAARINRAAEQLGLAKRAVKNIEDEARSSAIASGTLKDFKSEAEIATTLAQNRLGAHFSTAEENKRIAEMARKQVKEHHEKEGAKKIIDVINHAAGHDEKPKQTAAPQQQAPKPAQGDAGAGGHDDHGGGNH